MHVTWHVCYTYYAPWFHDQHRSIAKSRAFNATLAWHGYETRFARRCARLRKARPAFFAANAALSTSMDFFGVRIVSMDSCRMGALEASGALLFQLTVPLRQVYLGLRHTYCFKDNVENGKSTV